MNCLEIKQDYKMLSNKSKSLMSAAFQKQFCLTSNSFQFKMTYEKFTQEEQEWLTIYFDVLKAENVITARTAAQAHVVSLRQLSAR